MKKLITELKNKHAGQDIYVMASGKSLDYVDDSFFEGKVLVGNNDSYKRYNVEYVLNNNYQSALEAMSAGQTVVTSERLVDGDQSVKDFPNHTHYYFHHTQSAHCSDVDMSVFEKEGYLAIGATTVVPTIHFAYYLGAKNIIVCGVDSTSIEDEMYYEGYPVGDILSLDQHIFHISHSFNTVQQIIDKIRSLGVNVVGFNPFVNLVFENKKVEVLKVT
jgi:uncharacterized protein (DUF952 family)